MSLNINIPSNVKGSVNKESNNPYLSKKTTQPAFKAKVFCDHEAFAYYKNSLGKIAATAKNGGFSDMLKNNGLDTYPPEGHKKILNGFVEAVEKITAQWKGQILITAGEEKGSAPILSYITKDKTRYSFTETLPPLSPLGKFKSIPVRVSAADVLEDKTKDGNLPHSAAARRILFFLNSLFDATLMKMNNPTNKSARI